MRAVGQSFVPTPAMKLTVDASVQQPTTNFTYVTQLTNTSIQIEIGREILEKNI
jgi:hypothetical protein